MEDTKGKMAADIEGLVESNSRKDAKIDEMEKAQARMFDAIDWLEKKVNELEARTGTELVYKHFI